MFGKPHFCTFAILLTCSNALAGLTCYSGFFLEVESSTGDTDYPVSVGMSFGQIAIGSGGAEGIGAVAILNWSDSDDSCNTNLGDWEFEHQIWGVQGSELGKSIALQSGNLAVFIPSDWNGNSAIQLYLRENVNGQFEWPWQASFSPTAGYTFTGQLEMAMPWMAAVEEDGLGSARIRIFRRDESGWINVTSTADIPLPSDITMTTEIIAAGTPDSTFNNDFPAQGGAWVWRQSQGEWNFDGKVSPSIQATNLRAGQQVAAYSDYLALSYGGIGTPHPSLVDFLAYDANTQTWAPYSPRSNEPRGDSIGNVIDDMVMNAQGLYLSAADTNTGESAIGLFEFVNEFDITEIERTNVGDVSRCFDLAVDGNYVIAEGVASGLPNRSVWLEPVRDCNNNGEDDQCDLCRYPGWDIQNTGTLDYCECPGDIWESGGAPAVDMDDALVLMFNYWGRVDGFGDINTDGVADVQDLLVILQNWGPCS
ncbi:MAG: hypothetical protein MK077_10120 [Phycisphaerales bacterium]|nr:hypothetical protein [Phycisphaerales bacterium]